MKKQFRTDIMKIDEKRPNHVIISKASKLICSGEIIAFPTETVYGLGANALDPSAVSRSLMNSSTQCSIMVGLIAEKLK